MTDGSGAGWPLYAKLVITATGAPVFTVFTDPVTGHYSIPLVTGNVFRFAVTAAAPGYQPGGGLLPLDPAGGGGVDADWTLSVDATACDAPGYSRTGLQEGFDAGVVPPGWLLVTPSGAPWSVLTEDPCGTFLNTTGGSGPFAVSKNGCPDEVFYDNELRTPSVDMSGLSSAGVAFSSSFFAGAFDVADVDVSTDGGGSWTNVFRRDSLSDPGPVRHTIDITGLAAGQSDVRARFHFYNAFASGYWQVDDVFLGDPTCVPGDGGLVVGNVLDANTALGLNGALVEVLPQPGGASTETFATPEDPAQPDGMYILFAPTGPQSLRASLDPYTPVTDGVTAVFHGAVRLDFQLPAGRLDASPRPLSARVNPGESVAQPLSIANGGGASADFDLIELDVPPASAGGDHGPVRRSRTGARRGGARSGGPLRRPERVEPARPLARAGRDGALGGRQRLERLPHAARGRLGHRVRHGRRRLLGLQRRAGRRRQPRVPLPRPTERRPGTRSTTRRGSRTSPPTARSTPARGCSGG